MPYIPQFNKLSLQEMAYAPQLMRQQHDESIARNMELAEALKFDYLNQDADILEPKLQKYNSDVEKISKDLASSGFTHDIKNDILGLKTRFTGDDQIRNIRKNYAQAMSGWEETKKSLVQKGASGEEINYMKKAYFSPDAYKGAYDDDGFYQEFTPGATSGIYNIGKYAIDAMSGLGHIGSTIKAGGDTYTTVDLGNGRIGVEVRNATDGRLIDNISQVEAAKRFVKNQFMSPNTDEGLYARLTNKTPEYIDQVVEEVANMKRTREMTDPRYNKSLTGVTSTQSGESPNAPGENAPGENLATYAGVESDSPKYKNADIAEKVLKGEIEESNLSGAIGGIMGGKTKDEIVEEYESKYPLMFNENLTREQKEQQALLGTNIEKNNSSYVVRQMRANIDEGALGGLKPGEAVFRALTDEYAPRSGGIRRDDRRTFREDDFRSEGFKRKYGSKEEWKDVNVGMSASGQIFFDGPDGAKYNIDPSMLPEDASNIYTQLIRPIMDVALTENAFDGKPAPVGPTIGLQNDPKSRIFRVTTNAQNPYDLSNRRIEYGRYDDAGNEIWSNKTMSQNDFLEAGFVGMFSNLTNVDPFEQKAKKTR